MYNNEGELHRQIIGSLMTTPDLLANIPNPIIMDDFGTDKNAKCAFFAISNLTDSGAKSITIAAIEAYLPQFTKYYEHYRKNNVRNYLERCMEDSSPDNFMTFYKTLKKVSLVTELRNKGYNVSKYYYEGTLEGCGSAEEEAAAEELDKATTDDIISYVEAHLQDIKSRHTVDLCESIHAGDDIEEFIDSFSNEPILGPELPGEIMNAVSRGANLGEMYLCSAPTNVGKTRVSVFEACSVAYPIKYDNERFCFVHQKDKVPQRVLFLTTEMSVEEIRTMILAYLSGVETKRIKYTSKKDRTPEEISRLTNAGQIMKKYNDYFIIERINDPNTEIVQTVIKKHILLHKVKYIWFDYIFSSPSLINQFSKSHLREDVYLGLMSNALKELTTTYNVFIKSSTQVNGDALTDGGPRDQRVLRGSKAIADKPDFCYIMCQVTQKELNEIEEIRRQFQIFEYPTHVTDIYKTRNGLYKGCRIWSKINMGNGDRQDLFMTDGNNQFIQMESYEKVAVLEKTDIDNISIYLKQLIIEEGDE